MNPRPSEDRREIEAAEAFATRAERALRETRCGEIPATAVRVLLPANTDPLASPDPSRRARFLEHLTEMAEGAVLDRERLGKDPAGAEAPANGRETLSALACAACRGSCCRTGADHAHLTEETVARSLEAHPDWTLAELAQAYLDRLPAETYLDSCIYHAAAGCGLPRALRSSTCNRYLCAGLSGLRAALPENNPPPVLALMFDQGTWKRAALLEESGLKLLTEDPPRDLPD